MVGGITTNQSIAKFKAKVNNLLHGENLLQASSLQEVPESPNG